MWRLGVALLASSCAVAVAGCDGAAGAGARHRSAATPRPSVTDPGPKYVPAPQTGWLHGVGVDVPASWPRNKTRCGEPGGTTFIIQAASAAVPLCLASPLKNFHPDVAWLGGFVPPVQPNTGLGPVIVPARGLAAMTRLTIDGEPAYELSTRDRLTHEPTVLVVLPRKAVYVAVTSNHRTIRDAVIGSIRFVPKDPATGCPTKTTAYDAPPRHPVLDRRIDVSGAVGVVTCHYVAGWLETTAVSMPPAKLRNLMRAIAAAPHVTSARAPVDNGCENVDGGPPEWSDDGPVVLRFAFADGHTKTVVVRTVRCTRWQSYVYSGNAERRLTGALLLALPPVLVEFPGPDTM